MRRATFGFSLLASEGDADDVRGFLKEVRGESPEACHWRKHPQVLSAIPFAALCVICGGALGYMLGDTRQHPTPPRVAVSAIILASFGLLILEAAWLLS